MVTTTMQAMPRTPRVDVLRALLTVLALIPYLVGWTACFLVMALSWLWAATVLGWRDARGAREAR